LQYGFEKQDGIMNTQVSPQSFIARTAPFIQIPKPLLVYQESIPMPDNVEQFSLADFVLALTYQYLELGLPLDAALQAAAADLL
jgi:hypothetical protein